MRVVIAILIVFAVWAGPSPAGECVHGDDYYLECLEGEHTEDPEYPGISKSLRCVGVHGKHQMRWGNKAEREYLFSSQTYEQRQRLIAAAEKYVADPTAKSAALQVLALHGIRQAGKVDVFSELTATRYSDYVIWYQLAALQDPRTVKFAESRYGEIRGRKPQLEKRDRDALLEIVDCLYHIQTPESRTVLRDIATDEDDLLLRQYIKDVAGV